MKLYLCTNKGCAHEFYENSTQDIVYCPWCGSTSKIIDHKGPWGNVDFMDKCLKKMKQNKRRDK